MRVLFLGFIILLFGWHEGAAQVDCNAPQIMVSRTYTGSFSGSNSGLPKPSCGAYIHNDTWFRFTATESTHTIQVNGTVVDVAFAVYEGLCPDKLVQKACSSNQDCGKNPDAALTMYNLVPGAEYFIRVYPESPYTLHYFTILITGTDVENFYSTSGQAQVGSNPNCVSLLNNSGAGTGCAWYSRILYNNITNWSGVDLKFVLNFGNQGAAANDGMAFVITTVPDCGPGGNYLGAEGMGNSLIVEFDTRDDRPDDIADDHITLYANGDMNTPLAGPFAVPGLAEFADGNDHIFQFKWEPRTWELEVYIDGMLILQHANTNFISESFGGYVFQPFRALYFGFTASTTDGNQMSVCYNPHFLNHSPMHQNLFATICEGYSYTSPSGAVYDQTGSYTENFLDVNGCEAVRTINLVVRALPEKHLDVFVCAGQDYLGYSTPGLHSFIKPGIECDTVINIDLRVIDFFVDVNKFMDLSCLVDSAFMFGYYQNLPIDAAFDPTITYHWVSPTGSPFVGQGTDNISTAFPGSYFMEVQVTGESSGVPYSCVAQSIAVDIIQDIQPTNAKIEEVGILSCSSDTMVLDGYLSTPFPVNFQWSTNSGNIVGPKFLEAVTITQPGTYTLVITHQTSGCKDTATVIIQRAGFETTADIAKSSDLDCFNQIVTLTATLSENNVDSLVWSTENGKIVSDSLSETVQVSEAGEYTLTLFDVNGCFNTITVEVTEDVAIPVVNAGNDFLLNCLQPDRILSGTVSTSAGTPEFVWSDGSGNIVSTTNLNPLVTASGMYVLTVKDTANQCEKSDTVMVTENFNSPSLTSSGSYLITCVNQTVVLNPTVTNGNANTVYQWSTSDGNIVGSSTQQNATANATGNYILIATDSQSGCSDQITVNVTGSTDQPTANAGQDAILDCLNPFTSVSGTFTTSEPGNITLLWETIGGNIQGPNNGTSINISAPGLYIFHVTNSLNNCTDSDTLSVERNEDKPIITFDDFADLSCLKDTLHIAPSWTNAGANPTISWNTVDGNIVSIGAGSEIIIDAPGSYDITILNPETGCVTTAGVFVIENIDLPTGNMLVPDSITCSDNLVDLVFDPDPAGNFSYRWTTADGGIVGPGNNQTATANSAGTYLLQVTDNTNGCVQTFSTSVFSSNQLPDVSIATAEDLNCKQTSVSIHGFVNSSQDYNISWTALGGGNIVSGANTLDPEVDAAGLYVLTISNNLNGCAGSDTIQVNANITFPEIVGATTSIADCNGLGGALTLESIINSAGSHLFFIDNQEVVPNLLTFNNLNAGTYELVVEDQNGCTTQIDFTIGKSESVSLTLPDTLILMQGQPYADLFPLFGFDTTGMQVIGWTGAPYLNCTTCVNPVITPTHNAYLKFTAYSANGCKAADEVFIRVRKLKAEYFVPNAFSPSNHDGNNDFVTVFADDLAIPKIDVFRIYDRWGTEVFGRENFPPNSEAEGWNGFYRGKLMNPGVFVYYAQMTTVDGFKIIAKGSITLL